MKRGAFLIALFCIGLLGYGAGYFHREMKHFLTWEYHYSATDAHSRITKSGIPLPMEARALNFYSLQQGPDDQLWFSYKITPEEYEALKWANDADRPHVAPPSPPPEKVRWWNPPDKLEESSGDCKWIGYDHASETLFGYVFSI